MKMSIQILWTRAKVTWRVDRKRCGNFGPVVDCCKEEHGECGGRGNVCRVNLSTSSAKYDK